MDSAEAQRLVLQALAGDETAVRSLVDLLTPVLQARVARVLLAHARAGSDLRQGVEDLTQEAFLTLFADDGRVLRSWRPEQGLSLPNFAGLVARRRALSLLRTARGNPWREDPNLTPEWDEAAPEVGPEAQAATREELRRLLARLQESLSPQGWHLFDLLLVRERPLAEVQRRTGMSRDALYAWRSRLRKLARRLLAEIRQTAPGGGESTGQEGGAWATTSS